MDYLEEEKQKYLIPEKKIDEMLQEAWRKGFQAGAEAMIKKHINFMSTINNN